MRESQTPRPFINKDSDSSAQSVAVWEELSRPDSPVWSGPTQQLAVRPSELQCAPVSADKLNQIVTNSVSVTFRGPASTMGADL